jgi:hypothetical protein
MEAGEVKLGPNVLKGKVLTKTQQHTMNVEYGRCKRKLLSVAESLGRFEEVNGGQRPLTRKELTEASALGMKAIWQAIALKHFYPPPTCAGRWGLLDETLKKQIEADEQARCGQCSSGWTAAATERGGGPKFPGRGYKPEDLHFFTGRFAWSRVNPSQNEKLDDLADFFPRYFLDFPYNTLETLGQMVQERCADGVCVNACSPYHGRPQQGKRHDKDDQLEWMAGLTNFASQQKLLHEDTDAACQRLQREWELLPDGERQPYIEAGCGR